MYRCEDCKMLIEDFNDLEQDFDGSVICPHCQGDIEVVNECDCGEYKQMDEKLCEKCKISVVKRFKEFMDTFTEIERQCLNEIYDGEWF